MRVILVDGAAALVNDRSGPDSGWRHAARFLARCLGALRAGQRRRRAERELASLPDYLLADMGVRRADLAQAQRASLPGVFAAYGPDAHPRLWMHGGR
jgi:uncharacterized protein YjiS (DUF1127 family)